TRHAAAGVTRTDTMLCVQRDDAVPNTDRRCTGRRICEHAVVRVVREVAVISNHLARLSGVDAVEVTGRSDIVQSCPNDTGGTRQVYSIPHIVSNHRVSNMEVNLSACRLVYQDAFVGKPEYYAVLDVHGLGLEDVHASYAVAESVNGNTADC